MLKVGQVGGGIMGQQHMSVYQQYHRTQVMSLATSNPIVGRQISERFGANYYENHQEMLEKEDIDVVSIATPDFAHYLIARDALEAGKHVLVEKPLTMSVEESREILSLANKRNLTVMTLFSNRWISSYAQAKQLLKKKNLTPIMGYARKNDRIFVPTEMIKWADLTTPAYFLSSHDIDLMNWLFESKVVEVYASAVKKVLKGIGIDTPDAIQIQAKYENGAIATFESCWSYPNTYPTIVDSFVEVITEEEVIYLDRKIENMEYASPEGFTTPRNQLHFEITGKRRGAFVYAIEHFVDCILDNKPVQITLKSSHHVTAILSAAHISIKSGKPEKVIE
ncbi:Gfo/Idh/MocA family protein [Bacillus sp. JJ1562]|uniref:Gfo/Idh/MocA family protein n=1 Tax=Bacillus sp. JJ1562 TaxID=3122960 RepID=UPI003001AE8E